MDKVVFDISRTGRRESSPDALTLSGMGAIPARDTAAWSAMAGIILTTLSLCESAEGIGDFHLNPHDYSIHIGFGGGYIGHSLIGGYKFVDEDF